MIRVKGCRRCGGDIFWEENPRDSHWACLQCGHIAYPPPARQEARLVAEVSGRLAAETLAAGPEVLVVGEEEEVSLDLAVGLKALGFRPLVAPSWDAAWALLKEHHYLLVFLDAQGTHISALASAKRVKRLWPSTRVAVVVELGSDDEDLLLDTADLVVHKPLSRAGLRTEVGPLAWGEAPVFTSAA